jgi:gamma-glutamylcyclotransferase (GGCT)/AIG2-like uncharacterized protein YtfP
MPDYLFVYGTLRQELVGKTSRDLAALMKSLLFVGRGKIQGQLYDLGDYPAAIVGAEFNTRIVGEIYELPEPQGTLEILDAYEGFIPGELEASLFARIKEPVTLEDGRQLQCWIYVYNDWVSTGRLISDGNYLDYTLGGNQHNQNDN